VTVALAAGSNTITFGNPAGYAPNIDKIIVAPGLHSLTNHGRQRAGAPHTAGTGRGT
jgi:hypothetical protein